MRVETPFGTYDTRDPRVTEKVSRDAMAHGAVIGDEFAEMLAKFLNARLQPTVEAMSDLGMDPGPSMAVFAGKLRQLADTLDPVSVRRGAKQPASGKAGRNEPCPCGSRTKYKKCCALVPS